MLYLKRKKFEEVNWHNSWPIINVRSGQAPPSYTIFVWDDVQAREEPFICKIFMEFLFKTIFKYMCFASQRFFNTYYFLIQSDKKEGDILLCKKPSTPMDALILI